MESSWRQMVALIGQSGTQFELAAILVGQTPPKLILLQLTDFYGTRGFFGLLDTGGYLYDVPGLSGDVGPGFPWGWNVYADDSFPILWP